MDARGSSASLSFRRSPRRGERRGCRPRSPTHQCPRRHRLARVEQRGHEAVGGEDCSIVTRVDRVHRRSFDRRSQRHLTAWGDERVARRHDDRGRHVDRTDPLSSTRNGPTARAASSTAVRSCRRTCSRAHCSGPVALAPRDHLVRRTAGASRVVSAGMPLRGRRGSIEADALDHGREANRAAVAHSTRPSTRERCRATRAGRSGRPSSSRPG